MWNGPSGKLVFKGFTSFEGNGGTVSVGGGGRGWLALPRPCRDGVRVKLEKRLFLHAKSRTVCYIGIHAKSPPQA